MDKYGICLKIFGLLLTLINQAFLMSSPSLTLKYFNTQWTTTIIWSSVYSTRRGYTLDGFLCLCVLQSEPVLPRPLAATSLKLVMTSQREIFFLHSFPPFFYHLVLWSLKSHNCAPFLLPSVYVSRLEDDLKLSSSEESDGEQDVAKNASRNTLGRWAKTQLVSPENIRGVSLWVFYYWIQLWFFSFPLDS